MAAAPRVHRLGADQLPLVFDYLKTSETFTVMALVCRDWAAVVQGGLMVVRQVNFLDGKECPAMPDSQWRAYHDRIHTLKLKDPHQVAWIGGPALTRLRIQQVDLLARTSIFSTRLSGLRELHIPAMLERDAQFLPWDTLQKLTLTDAANTPRAVFSYAAASGLSNLHTLHLTNVRGSSLLALCNLAKPCTSMRVLCLEGVSDWTQEVYNALVRAFPNVTYLSLRNCYHFQPALVGLGWQHLTQLILPTTNCGASWVAHMLQSSQELRRLVLPSTERFNRADHGLLFSALLAAPRVQKVSLGSVNLVSTQLA